MDPNIAQPTQPNMPGIQTPVVQPAQQVPPQASKSFLSNKLILIATVILIVLLIGGGWYFVGMKNIQPVSHQPVVENSPTPSIQNSMNQPESNEILIPYTPHFDKLEINNLSNFIDVRGVYPYKNNLIITGINQIVEYNPSKKTLIRVLDRTKLDSVYSTAIIGENLYIVSVPGLLNGKSWIDSWAAIYRLDLNTGKIIKKYFGDPTKDKRHINLYITSKDNFIWATSDDGVFRINTQDDSIKIYDKTQLTLAPSCITQILNKDGIVFGLVNCSDKLGKLTHDEASDSWSYSPLSSKDFASYINLRLSDYGLDMPTYSYVSNQVNGKYYLFADNGVYTLAKNKFPKFYKKIIFPLGLVADKNSSIIYITKDEKYALLIGPQTCGPDSQCSPVIGVIIDLTTGELSDLFKNNSVYNVLSIENKSNLANEISRTILEENGTTIVLTDAKNKKDVITINLLTKEVVLNTNY